jgi:hypothetical protein
MTDQKHFKAVHRETKEEIEFGLEDIGCYLAPDYRTGGVKGVFIAERIEESEIFDNFEDWLKDYELFYWHGGEWHEYE